MRKAEVRALVDSLRGEKLHVVVEELQADSGWVILENIDDSESSSLADVFRCIVE